MKYKISVIAGSLLLAAVSLSAQAADLKVKGYIAPASCSFTIGNAVIDYGRIDPNTLSPTSYTKLAKKSTPYAIRCGSNAKAKIGVKVVDNRSSTRIPGLMTSQFGTGYRDNYNYGLGATAKGQKIGGYVVHLRNSLADGKPAYVITDEGYGGTWDPRSTEALGHTANISTWRTGSAVTPAQVNTVTGNLEVQAVINKTAELDMSNQVNLDGQATLELRYL
ncbi:DUF1120 domain-containing protein [Pseudomonas kairouanensis]|uniref:DUF1120 domain-containing protein n=1 Tax=Pseudomonas kairouanensis TaxID=2293832 RepID=A0A4Z0AL14_9PSED|nr:DUF1120 domain-containing protein [Pseudomonas kairouanensis]TFY87063.1 DUF1120 domain-containing protein [Pseudomonas kairouanensis]